MRLYHSSNTIVEHPDVQHSRNYLDFGRGFYLTSIHEQAVRYAQRFKRRGQPAWLNVYELAGSLYKWNIQHFDTYDKQWLDFVVQCRDGKDVGNRVIVGAGSVVTHDIPDDVVVAGNPARVIKTINQE